ncbi:MAG: hypothetical protein ACE5NP_05075 [Anaerolineae bacterium]
MTVAGETTQSVLTSLAAYYRLERCRECECLQGALVQLSLESEDEGLQAEIESLQVARSEMHGCLGCDPCPPADLLAEYLLSGAACSL